MGIFSGIVTLPYFFCIPSQMWGGGQLLKIKICSFGYKFFHERVVFILDIPKICCNIAVTQKILMICTILLGTHKKKKRERKKKKKT